MITTIIEEGIYDIKTKESIKKAIFTFDDNKLTRQCIYNDYHYSNDRIDIIDRISIHTNKNIPTILLNDIVNGNYDIDKITNDFKESLMNRIVDTKNLMKRNIDAEMPAFKNPIITVRNEF